MSRDLFAYVLILLPPLLLAAGSMAGMSARHGPRPALSRPWLGVYLVFGVLLQLVLGWIYFRDELGAVVGLLVLYNGLYAGGLLAQRRARRRDAPGR